MYHLIWKLYVIENFWKNNRLQFRVESFAVEQSICWVLIRLLSRNNVRLRAPAEEGAEQSVKLHNNYNGQKKSA